MNDNPCLLTIDDFTTMSTIRERWSERDHVLLPQLRAKLEAAVVVFPDDLPRDVASLGSQIAYAIGEETHVATLTSTIGLDRRWLPITLPIGLALLGQREGWAMNFDIGSGRSKILTLGRVIEQVEASWPGRFSPNRPVTAPIPLRPVRNSPVSRGHRACDAPPEDDDPGPAAA